jgi:hypothetical protein
MFWGKCILYCHQNLPQLPSDTGMMNKKEHFKEALRIFKYIIADLDELLILQDDSIISEVFVLI